MGDKVLNELKDKLNGLANCKESGYVSLGLSTKFATINNVVKAGEILILDDEIVVHAGHLNINFVLNNDTDITKYDYGVESEYYINNDDTELYINLLGT